MVEPAYVLALRFGDPVDGAKYRRVEGAEGARPPCRVGAVNLSRDGTEGFDARLEGRLASCPDRVVVRADAFYLQL